MTQQLSMFSTTYSQPKKACDYVMTRIELRYMKSIDWLIEQSSKFPEYGHSVLSMVTRLRMSGFIVTATKDKDSRYLSLTKGNAIICLEVSITEKPERYKVAIIESVPYDVKPDSRLKLIMERSIKSFSLTNAKGDMQAGTRKKKRKRNVRNARRKF